VLCQGSRPDAQGGSNRFVVQIGAFRTEAQVESAWTSLNRRYAFISNYEPLSTTVTINGRASSGAFRSPASTAKPPPSPRAAA
jgi:hypothetical protein